MGSSVMGISMQLGALTANGLTAVLTARLGWRAAFGLYSLTGVLWAAVFYFFFRNRPEDHSWTNEAERALIRSGKPARESSPLAAEKPALFAPRPVWLVMLTSVSLWAVCSQSFFRAYAYELYYTWFPAFLEKGHGVKMVDAGLLAMIPQVGGGLGCLVGGGLVDALFAWTGSKWVSRSGTAAVALSLCALSTWAATWTASPLSLVLILALGAFCASLAGPAAWSATIDISPKLTGVIFGIMNMAGNIGGYVCPVTVGKLMDHIEATAGDWNLVLYLFVGVNLACALCWLFLNPNRPVVE
jgi:sugar phosphate permease